MRGIIVTGIGTDVGKTVVSAIVTTLMNGEYWKPIECGDSDTKKITDWLDPNQHKIHEPSYSLKSSLSPHHAARLENTFIDCDAISIPQTERFLVIEGVGGVFVPLTAKFLCIDFFKKWNLKVIIVSRHYLGSINHTLLTIEALKQRQIPILGIVFNGEPNPDGEAVILERTNLPLLGRVLPELEINSQTIQKYVKQWQPLKLCL